MKLVSEHMHRTSRLQLAGNELFAHPFCRAVRSCDPYSCCLKKLTAQSGRLPN